MNCVEEVVQFDCGGECLFGIIAVPLGAALASTAVLIIVGGPQYRVGAHRQFVQLARTLAAAGHAVLRFDYRGMGDSAGQQRNFEAVSEDIARAIDALLQRAPQAQRVVLLGLCDGAAAALVYMNTMGDARVGGLCLLNPWARSDATLARTHLKHYYRKRLFYRDFWRKLLRGGVGLGRIAEFLQALHHGLAGAGRGGPAQRQPPFQDAMARAWQRFEGRILLVLSGDDLTAREFIEYVTTAKAWRGLLAGPRIERVDLPGADHTLSDPGARERFEQALLGWLAHRQTAP
jgi:exosortase A-associated hydrolase 1